MFNVSNLWLLAYFPIRFNDNISFFEVTVWTKFVPEVLTSLQKFNQPSYKNIFFDYILRLFAVKFMQI